jgi:hypothetical protein
MPGHGGPPQGEKGFKSHWEYLTLRANALILYEKGLNSKLYGNEVF